MRKVWYRYGLLLTILLIGLVCIYSESSFEFGLKKKYYSYNNGNVPKRIEHSVLTNPWVEEVSIKYGVGYEYSYYNMTYLRKMETVLKNLKDNGKELPRYISNKESTYKTKQLTIRIKGRKKDKISLYIYDDNKSEVCLSSVDKKEIAFYEISNKYKDIFLEIYDYVNKNGKEEYDRDRYIRMDVEEFLHGEIEYIKIWCLRKEYSFSDEETISSFNAIRAELKENNKKHAPYGEDGEILSGGVEITLKIKGGHIYEMVLIGPIESNWLSVEDENGKDGYFDMSIENKKEYYTFKKTIFQKAKTEYDKEQNGD